MRFVLCSLIFFILTGGVMAREETAVFAGGCFWCSESDFEKVEGVLGVVSGYSGGHVVDPTYEDVTSQGSGHYECVQVRYDAEVVSFRELVDKYWRTVDPTDAGGQFCDRGSSYRTAVFYGSEAEREIIEASKLEAEGVLGEKIVTEVLPASRFYRAEEYHQDYYKKNKVRYNVYRFSCGRDGKLRDLWG